MGFLFNLLMSYFVFPLMVLVLIAFLLMKKLYAVKVILFILTGIVGLVLLSITANWCFSKTILSKNDFYGEYIIDRSYFPGKQADWQYNHFRFEIVENDSIYLYETDNDKIITTYKGTINTLDYYESARLVINLNQTWHHIMITNPTIYRKPWSFMLVFNSPQFHNMYFKKGKWDSID